MWASDPGCGCVSLGSKLLSVLILVSCCFSVSGVNGLWCDRTPAGVNVPKLPGDNGYKIVISGDPDKPDKYIPEAVYTGKGLRKFILLQITQL